MNNKKRFFIFLLAAVAAVLLFGGCQQEQPVAAGLVYTLSEDASCYEVTAPRENNLTTQSITVPATYEGKPVKIATRAFYALPELVSVTVEGAAGEIGSQAFMNCPKLETVILKGAATVGEKAFNNCASLKSITFGEGISFIGNSCVSDCPALETVVVGDDCTGIGASAFKNCQNLKNVTLGKQLSTIAPFAFAYTKNLTQIQFPEQTPLLLGDYAFSYSGLLEIHLPANITMGEYVFDHLAWDDVKGYSMCRAVYFYALEPTAQSLGTNAIGYTWDRTEEDDPELGAFMVYVPEEAEDAYIRLMEEECDESWTRCVLNLDKLGTFSVTD